MEEKKWKKPVLIVLMKGAPEEHILQACKSGSTSISTGWQAKNNGCYRGSPEKCNHYCSTIASS